MNEDILVTGVAGAGKSTVCSKLGSRGYKAYDMEDREELFTMIDSETGEQFEEFDNTDLTLVKRSRWVCDKERLEELMDKDSDGPVFYCGIASNLDELLPLFDRVFLLEPSEDVLRERLEEREGNDFGSDHKVREWVLEWKGSWEKEMKEKGAEPLDADYSVERIVDKLLEQVIG